MQTLQSDGQAVAKEKLPKLRPNVNRKAQQIIKAHLQSLETGSLDESTATVPILAKLEGTAPRMARTHDISHLLDQPKCLAPSVPATIISEEDHVYEESLMHKDASSVYREEDGLWHTKIFPSEKPSSRTDAIMLDAWITQALARHQEEHEVTSKEDFAKTVEDLVPLLSVALHEMVRQVMHHCSERGVALERIWRTYIELFQRVLQQLQESIQFQKERTAEAQTMLQEVTKEFRALKKSHPEQMHRIILDLEIRFTQRQQGFEEELKEAEQDNTALKNQLRNQHREAELWYPGFVAYQDSYIRNLIPQHKAKAATQRRTSKVGQEVQAATEMAPEVALAEDFKRLLTVFAPDKRRLIGQELVDLIEGGQKGNEQQQASSRRKSFSQALLDEQQSDLDKLEELQKEVQAQEDHIRAMKNEIMKLESAKAFGMPDDDVSQSSDSDSDFGEAEDKGGGGGGFDAFARASISMVNQGDKILIPGKRGSILNKSQAAAAGAQGPRDDDLSSNSGLSEGSDEPE
mmetsp:Transcript_38916/g.70202  ORF Transcript_38916/g.70202 Transcript_38916/m.70202 type:complete len:519 (-) Transcript_38916:16-1572(-)|eukprot:CAMPEP_0197628580 /NCGR_PEP_ID=MMETSP1338-20131121/6825_1 /TAXON_ID=43686 ORGANISM="Pelagodinium beii, Strain RCC1491" /NCGR_SAMPLE_ID=MMETSP1338 /ASSEMBLY_ACC=CAM_ASM_000754 /LENGTH=518 /DNA_ID=CAMNT_0043199563 /DNA_START=76 /DNA_END=1632 /DNA_ORIENTATION=+